MSLKWRRSSAYSTHWLLSHDMADRVETRPTSDELWRADTRPTTEVHDKTTELHDKTCTDASTRNAARHSGNDVSQRHSRVVPPYISRCVSERSGKRSTTITNTRQRYNSRSLQYVILYLTRWKGIDLSVILCGYLVWCGNVTNGEGALPKTQRFQFF